MQAYLIPISGNDMLIVRKNIVCQRFNGRPAQRISVCNSPGRWALSGGQADRNEKLFDAATREFREETGVRVTGQRGDFREWNGQGYGVVYWRPQDPNGLLLSVQQNIQGDLTPDDELHEAAWVSIPAAMSRFGWGLPEEGWMTQQIDAAKRSLEAFINTNTMPTSDHFLIAEAVAMQGLNGSVAKATAGRILEDLIRNKMYADPGDWNYAAASNYLQNRYF